MGCVDIVVLGGEVLGKTMMLKLWILVLESVKNEGDQCKEFESDTRYEKVGGVFLVCFGRPGV